MIPNENINSKVERSLQYCLHQNLALLQIENFYALMKWVGLYCLIGWFIRLESIYRLKSGCSVIF